MSIPEQINKIEEMSKKLNTVALEVAPLIKELDEALRRMNVGVEVWLEPPLEKLSNAHIQLGYGRTDTTTCGIAVRSICLDSDTVKFTRPISQCSRDTQIASVARFPQLFTEILKKLDSVLPSAEEARVELPNLIEIFKAQPKKRRT